MIGDKRTEGELREVSDKISRGLLHQWLMIVCEQHTHTYFTYSTYHMNCEAMRPAHLNSHSTLYSKVAVLEEPLALWNSSISRTCAQVPVAAVT